VTVEVTVAPVVVVVTTECCVDVTVVVVRCWCTKVVLTVAVTVRGAALMVCVCTRVEVVGHGDTVARKNETQSLLAVGCALSAYNRVSIDLIFEDLTNEPIENSYSLYMLQPDLRALAAHRRHSTGPRGVFPEETAYLKVR
jgi:hypothetical protein